MILKPLISVLLLISYGVTFAQPGSSPERIAVKHIDKHRWQKAESKLRKSLAKDTLSPSVRYTLSIFYFHPDNPSFNLDSAYRYAVGALTDYSLSPGRERERLARAGVDSVGLIALRAKIDSAAFEVAKATNTEASYLEFLTHFPSSTQREMAAQLRDEVAYQDALQLNTHEAFFQFLSRYPDARRADDARNNYHKLIFYERTKDRRLHSYEKFLADYPETPYRSEVYRNIYEISTADGNVDSFLAFMTRYPASGLVRTAEQMIFYLLAEEDEGEWPEAFLSDSLQHLLNLNRAYLIPFYKNDLYGFMDENGMEVLSPRYQTIHPDYLCGYVTDEILILDHELVARNGSPILREDVSDITDLGVGFMMARVGDHLKLIHKAGFVFADSLQEARVLSKTFVALKQNDAWFLYTLTGRLLDDRPWNDISAFQNAIVFTGEGRKFIIPKDRLAQTADGNPLPLSDPFEEIRQWPNGLIWGKSGDYQGLLDQSLQGVIRFDRHILSQADFGAVAAQPNGFVLYNWAGKKSSSFDQVNLLGKKVAVKKNRQWFLYDPVRQKIESISYDSLRAEGAFVVGLRADSVDIHFAGKQVRSFRGPLKISFIPGLDSTSFLAVQLTSREKGVFDLQGRRLFSASFDAMEYAGNGIFVVTRKDRKGLLNRRGETLLPAEFDAVGSARGYVVSVLKNKKFGAYHIDLKKLIKPQYDRNLIPYASSFVVIFKDGYYGFLGWDNKPVSAFEFDEVNYWNDSLALVRKGQNWNLYDLSTREIVETNLQTLNLVRDTEQEKIAIIQRDNSFGVISNKGHIVIPVTFSDVINLGSAESPLYFTEKHVPEASIHIVIYFDESGEMLRKEIYDDGGDYDKIYCSDK